jgi:GAF domain-containing protein
MSGIEHADFGSVMAAAVRTMHDDMTSEEMLQSVVDVAAISVPGFDRASISMVERRGRDSVKAASDDLVRELDLLQYALHEGPCVDAMRGPRLIPVPHLRHEQRWPRYVAAAVERGITAQMAIMVYLDKDATTLGGLNLYSTESEEVSDEAKSMAELFAAQAAVALSANRRRLHLDAGMQSRQLVGEAVGIVMERYQLDEHHAFQFLARTSTSSNIKLRQVAQDLVDEANLRRPRS